MPLLELRKLTKSFGGLTAVNALDLSIEKGEIIPANKDKCLELIRKWQQAIKGAV